MIFNSKFHIGDQVWVPYNNEAKHVTIGKIIIEHTDSKGIEGEETFDNYKAQKKYVEKYMCTETGIGSGSIWELGKNLFDSMDKCLKAIEDNNKDE